jgi:diaminopimelate epimerase
MRGIGTDGVATVRERNKDANQDLHNRDGSEEGRSQSV